MTNNDLLRLAGFKTIGTEQAGDGLIVDVELEPPANIERCDCPPMTEIRKHGLRAVRFKDFPIQRQAVTLRIKRQRWRCQGCGKVKLETLPGIDADVSKSSITITTLRRSSNYHAYATKRISP